MKSALLATSIVMLVMLGWGPVAGADEPVFESIFDGESLHGWDGDPKFWSVQEGAITGRTTAENPATGNTFIIWRGGKVDDFELRLQFRIEGGNSGIQYRSREVTPWVMSGYQADFDAEGQWTGSLYDEKGRGVLARRGSRVTIGSDGAKKDVGQTTPEKEILDSVKQDGWNQYTIIVEGNHIQQLVNGLLSVDVVDDQAAEREMSGLLGLQLHAGPPMTVKFRNIRLRRIGETGHAAPDK